jgi:aminoglycoside phosphotransferase (APT) family kinase protein
MARSCAAVWPGPPIRRFRAIQEGWTHLLLDADGRWIFRIPRRRSAADHLQEEVALLNYLSARIRARVPDPFLVGALPRPKGWPFVVYARLPGEPLRNLTLLRGPERRRLASYLAALFDDLASCPARRLAEMGVARLNPNGTARRYVALRERFRRRGARRVSPDLRREIEATFTELLRVLRASRYRPQLVHGDLWPSHILWDRRAGRPTGVVDWEDASVGDRAMDLVALEGIDAELRDEFLLPRRAQFDRHFETRLALYRRIVPVHGLLFGIESKRAPIEAAHRRELRQRLLA